MNEGFECYAFLLKPTSSITSIHVFQLVPFKLLLILVAMLLSQRMELRLIVAGHHPKSINVDFLNVGNCMESSRVGINCFS